MDKETKIVEPIRDEPEEILIECPKCGDCDLSCDNCEYCGSVPMEEAEESDEISEPFTTTNGEH